jgi:putative tryptophan/tyrosine transport system substrate-binding protein
MRHVLLIALIGFAVLLAVVPSHAAPLAAPGPAGGPFAGNPTLQLSQDKPIPPAPADDLLVEDVPLPGNVTVSNPQNIPENFKRFSGAWVGAFSGQLHHILIVENVMADGNANVVYAVGDYPAANVRRQWTRHDATIVGNTLRVEEFGGWFATYELTGDGKLDATYEAGNPRPRATMLRIELADLTRSGETIVWTSEARVGDLLVEDVPLPGNVTVSNPQNIPENFKRFSGAWVGAWGGQLHHILIVESVMADGKANVVYAVGDNAVVRRQWHRHDATIVGNTLSIGRFATYELTGDGKLDAIFEAGNARPPATMSRIELADLTQPGETIAWTSEFLGTAAKESGKPIRPDKSAIPTIGLLALESNPNAGAWFRQGLNEVGFVDGRNVRIEIRSANEQAVRLPELAADLVRSQPAMIVAVDSNAIYAAKTATSTIPIVFAFVDDPVKDGLVASLNRPGGNMTGVALIISELLGKQLDLLHQIVPRAAPVGYLSQSGVRGSEELTSDIVAASRALETELVVAEARSRRGIETAFATFVQRGTGGLVVGPYLLFDLNYNRVLELAALNKIPTMYYSSFWVRGGGLMSYSANFEGGHKVVVDYVARILRGAKPADLPVQRPTAFDLVINLKTAKALGLTVPPTLLVLATELID